MASNKQDIAGADAVQTSDKRIQTPPDLDINDMLKNVAQLVHSRHRSVHNFIMNLLAAMGAYCFFATKPEVNFEYEVPESNGQIVLWQ